ncbi:MAG: RNA polymerase sigma factor [Eubacteriales bacterium]
MDRQSGLIKNDVASINDVVEKYSSLVYRIARTNLKSGHDADDVYQDVFLRYIEKERTFESEEHRKAWFIRVTINRCKSFFTSSWRQKTTSIDDEDLQDKLVFDDSRQREIYEAVLGLPDKLKNTVILFYFESMSIAEISKTLKTTEASVKMRLMRARQALKLDMEGGDKS